MADTLCPTCQSLRPRGTRFYARVLSANLECPFCGWLMWFASGRRQRPRGHERIWEPRWSRLVCPACEHVFVVGLVLWPSAGRGKAIPCDQLMTVQQSREWTRLRQEAGGFWMEESKGFRAEETNLTGRICTCPEQGTDPTCLIHGVEAHEEGDE